MTNDEKLIQPMLKPVAWHEPGAYGNVTVYKQWAKENRWLPLYTETQVQELLKSFEQSVTDPENQPSQYGTVLMKEWQGLTDEEIKKQQHHIDWTSGHTYAKFARAIEAKLKEKNCG